MELPKFKHQPPNNDNLCAYYALYHFLGDVGYSKEKFTNAASNYYHKAIVVKKLDADEMAIDGNDPSIIESVLKDKGELSINKNSLNEKDFLDKEKVIIAQGGHFFTLLKDDNGDWWNNNSLQQNLTNISDLSKFSAPYKNNLHQVFFK